VESAGFACYYSVIRYLPNFFAHREGP